MHVNVIMGGQLDEHLLFGQITISIILYGTALYLIEIEIKYDDDDRPTVRCNFQGSCFSR